MAGDAPPAHLAQIAQAEHALAGSSPSVVATRSRKLGEDTFGFDARADWPHVETCARCQNLAVPRRVWHSGTDCEGRVSYREATWTLAKLSHTSSTKPCTRHNPSRIQH